jgi:prepilin peptidase CpaA
VLGLSLNISAGLFKGRAVVSDALWDPTLALEQWAAVLVASFVGAVIDLRTRRIPNLLVVLTLVGGLAWAVSHKGWPGAVDGLLAAVLLSAPFVVLFIFGGGGAGDAKLMGALGFWLGVYNATAALVAVALAGVVLAVGVAAYQRRLGTVLGTIWTTTNSLCTSVFLRRGRGEIAAGLPPPSRSSTMPYGPAIFLGVSIAALGVYLWRH